MAEDRKTLEQRAQMTDIERLRHCAAQVMATAILRIWPEAQFVVGPPVENGFYYDVELPAALASNCSLNCRTLPASYSRRPTINMR